MSRGSLLLWLRDAESYPDAHAHLAALRPGEAYTTPVEADAGVAEQHNRKERRAIPFGPLSVSKIIANGEFISWGASCCKHTNAWEPHLGCKKSLSFRGGRVTPDEARIRMEMWLLAGHSIPQSNAAGKQEHFAVDFMSMPLEDEAELDRRASLVAAMGS